MHSISRWANQLKSSAEAAVDSFSSHLTNHGALNSNSIDHNQVNTNEIIEVGSFHVRIIELLGEGGYSFVYRVEDINNGKLFALKKMMAQTAEQRGIAEKEITVMKKLQNTKHIVQFYSASKRDGNRCVEYFILMEHCANGSLIDLIKQKQAVHERLNEIQIANIFLQCATAVKSLHLQDKPIAHRDLKIENILISDGIMKLCDFGSCTTRVQAYLTAADRAEEEERIQRYSTSMYRAPEMCDLYSKQVISELVDVWALGCILYCLAYFTHPFQDAGNLGILSGNYQLPEEQPYSKYLLSLLKRLLAVKPPQRPNINQVIEMINLWLNWLKSDRKADIQFSPTNDEAKTEKKKSSKKSDENNTEKGKKKKEKKKIGTNNSINTAATATSAGFADDFDADWGAVPTVSNTHNTSTTTVFHNSTVPNQPRVTNLFDLSSIDAALPITQPLRSVSNPVPNTINNTTDNTYNKSHTANNHNHPQQSASSNNLSSNNNNFGSVFDSFQWNLTTEAATHNKAAVHSTAKASAISAGTKSSGDNPSPASLRSQRRIEKSAKSTSVKVSQLNPALFKQQGKQGNAIRNIAENSSSEESSTDDSESD
jgi:serine/threonine protein kinase